MRNPGTSNVQSGASVSSSTTSSATIAMVTAEAGTSVRLWPSRSVTRASSGLPGAAPKT